MHRQIDGGRNAGRLDGIWREFKSIARQNEHYAGCAQFDEQAGECRDDLEWTEREG
ncbi:hypothetical protein [Burkholderia sola]|uniref:hypothetical protein n=1 Tax=Burkholderia sola TaxID=2843302 RepID=UPI0023DDA69F|nr:hypothetical protein [Burkholderia sola]MDF3082576.1 hypothetical protein [Burkholderia sola]